MDFGRLSIIVLLALQVSSQVSLIRNFDPQDCIIEGTVITLTCTVEDRNNGSVATIISGSPAIFNCPSVNTVGNNRLYLQHSQTESATAMCGDFVSAQIVEVRNGMTYVYIIGINITTTIAMNGGYVECTELGIQDIEEIQLANIKAPPDTPTLYVEFPSDATFVIHWSQANEGAQISHYSTNVTGEDCGECTNLGIVSNAINQLSCTGWEPNGQVCNVTVTAANASACGLQQLSSSHLVYLRVPEAPHFEDVIPVYSYNLEELQSMEILLAVDSTVDPNDLPITFQVNVERSSRDDLQKCSLNFSADRNCIANVLLVKYWCRIDFAVSSCPLLLLQKEDYQIGFFSQNSIGRSSNATFHVLSYANLKVEILFSESHPAHNCISIGFSQVYARVTAVLQYGANCQALDHQNTLIGFNVTTLIFPVPIISNICCIITTNYTFPSFAIQGSFSVNSSSPGDVYDRDCAVPIAISAVAGFFIPSCFVALTMTLYKARKTLPCRQYTQKIVVSRPPEERKLTLPTIVSGPPKERDLKTEAKNIARKRQCSSGDSAYLSSSDTCL